MFVFFWQHQFSRHYPMDLGQSQKSSGVLTKKKKNQGKNRKIQVYYFPHGT